MSNKKIVNKALIVGLSATVAFSQTPVVAFGAEQAELPPLSADRELQDEGAGESNLTLPDGTAGEEVIDETGSFVEESVSEESVSEVEDKTFVDGTEADQEFIASEGELLGNADVVDSAPLQTEEVLASNELSEEVAMDESAVEVAPEDASAADPEALVDESVALAAPEYSVERFTFEDELTMTPEELFAGYVDQTFYAPLNGDIATFGDYGETHLNTLEKFYYHELKDLIEKVAAGEVDFTGITISLSNRTAAELGKPFEELTYGEVQAALRKVFITLLVDCPYDFYWFDKTIGVTGVFGVELTGEVSPETTIGFTVLKTYRANATGTKADRYITNTALTKTASQAAAKAQAIVTTYESLSDYEKIVAYKDWICKQVTYDHGASFSLDYGDPWQVIHVFDDDPSTNVVCEGYAKAFQYLCDLSRFKSASTQSYLVDGSMGGVAHMWNVVTLTGAQGAANYLVDLTNTDGDENGDLPGVFLNGALDGDVATGYAYKRSAASSLFYTYDKDTIGLYGSDASSILVMATADYQPLAPGEEEPEEPGTGIDPEKPGSGTGSGSGSDTGTGTTPEKPSEPSDPDSGEDEPVVDETLASQSVTATLTYGYGASQTPTLSVQASENNSTPTYQWYCNDKAISGATNSSYKIPGGLHSGTYVYHCEVTWPGTEEVAKTSKGSAVSKVTVQKRKLTIAPQSGQWKYANDADPVLGYAVSGNTSLVGTDKLSGALGRKAGEVPGTYAITLGTLSSPDYELTLTGNATFEVRSHWVKRGGKWKYATASGYAKGWVQDGSTWYHCDSQGIMQTGWIKLRGAWYYLTISGAMATGWQSVGGAWYYFNASGAMATGWLNLGGTWYYLASSGAMQTGWLQLGDSWYYLGTSGAMLTGWQNIGGAWYYLETNGAMATGWKQIGSAWYYLNGSGAMLTGWQYIGGAWYYFFGSGIMAANTSVEGYTLSASGAMV